MAPSRVEGALPASPPRFSLLDVPGVNLVGDGESRWLQGITVEPEACGITLPDSFDDLDESSTGYPYWWDNCGDGSEAARDVIPAGAKALDTTKPDNVVASPYTIWTGFRCSSLDVGHSEERNREVEARLRRRLLACTPKLVEHEVWTGQVAQAAGFDNPFLTAATEEVVDGGALGYVTALAELEQALGECGCSGQHIIHAQPRVVTAWAAEGLITQAPTAGAGAQYLMTTAGGTYVAKGTGYPGTAPDGAAAVSYGRSYAYGSGLVRVTLGAPQVPNLSGSDFLVRDDNTVELRAERDVVHIFDDSCCVIGVQVNLCDRLCGLSS